MSETPEAAKALLKLSRTAILAMTPKQRAELEGALRMVLEEIEAIKGAKL